MKKYFKKIIPKFLINYYHYCLAVFANFWYKNPSEKLIVIGVTGTAGKSSVCYLISKMLDSAGYKVGCASTIFFKVDRKEWINDKKMTMLGRFQLQKLLSQMVKANCQYAIVETTSEGIKQSRHVGINYDLCIFTNLYPEHIESHGSFENYKQAKLKLFKKLEKQKPKLIAGQRIEKTIIANLDDENVDDFLNQWAEKKYGFTTTNKSTDQAQVIRAEDIKATGEGIEFSISSIPFRLKILGEHNVGNVLAAVCVGLSQDLKLPTISRGLENFSGIPGRLEFIDEGQDFKVIVDYAFEPKAMEKLYRVVSLINHQKTIHVLGGTGGGRDKARRPILGKMAGEKADYIIVTNEDPYDEDPQEIIDQVASGAVSVGKVENQNLFKIMDRRLAIAKALSLAKNNDLVLVTGKGSEQAIVVKDNQKIPWDDRQVIKEELAKLKLKKDE
ncbi:MAG: UDP-N-acetylmuramyl-tripeptide synthetase [Candidatus Buchananbacteria bacterium]|nr:UDP-N-acetylmuramyl-tripeptide synthetase [Candidatus Buchananbacteria bacterium]